MRIAAILELYAALVRGCEYQARHGEETIAVAEVGVRCELEHPRRFFLTVQLADATALEFVAPDVFVRLRDQDLTSAWIEYFPTEARWYLAHQAGGDGPMLWHPLTLASQEGQA